MIDDSERYRDIMHLSRPVSERHPPMAMIDRAAQFSPFAALTGYDAAVRETARLTEEKLELDESRKAQLDRRLQQLQQHSGRHPRLRAVYFLPDTRKAGGAYVTAEGELKKLDAYGRQLLLQDGTAIPFGDLYSLESQVFDED